MVLEDLTWVYPRDVPKAGARCRKVLEATWLLLLQNSFYQGELALDNSGLPVTARSVVSLIIGGVLETRKE